VKVYATKVEGVDETGELLFKVESFDEHTATIELTPTVHNAESLEQLFTGLRWAFAKLGLE